MDRIYLALLLAAWLASGVWVSQRFRYSLGRPGWALVMSSIAVMGVGVLFQGASVTVDRTNCGEALSAIHDSYGPRCKSAAHDRVIAGREWQVTAVILVLIPAAAIGYRDRRRRSTSP